MPQNGGNQNSGDHLQTTAASPTSSSAPPSPSYEYEYQNNFRPTESTSTATSASSPTRTSNETATGINSNILAADPTPFSFRSMLDNLKQSPVPSKPCPAPAAAQR